MNNKDAINFVKGALDKRALIDDYRFFEIDNGYIRACNSVFSSGCPIDFEFNCAPNGELFLKALKEFSEFEASLTRNGKLRIRSEKYNTLIPCHAVKINFRHVAFKQLIDLNFDLVNVLKKAVKFISKDMAHIWACGVYFSNEKCYCTNNIVILEQSTGFKDVNFVLPLPTVLELLRIGENPEKYASTDNAIAFYYKNGAYIDSLLIDQEWPDISSIFNANPHAYFTTM